MLTICGMRFTIGSRQSKQWAASQRKEGCFPKVAESSMFRVINRELAVERGVSAQLAGREALYRLRIDHLSMDH